MTHLQHSASTETEARKLSSVEEDKLAADIGKLCNKYDRNMDIASLAAAVGKLVQDQWGAHNLQRFTNQFTTSLKEAQEAELKGN